MSKFSKLLCVVDPTAEQQPAVERAAWLARATGAKIELAICYYNEFLIGLPNFDGLGIENVQSHLLETYEGILEAIAAPLRESGLTVSVNTFWDHPLHEGIVRHAERCDADLVLKDTHHHSAISRAFLTNTDWNLIRTCPLPLWLVKPDTSTDEPIFVAAVDPLNENAKPAALDVEILKRTASIAKAVEGEIHAFHSFNPMIAAGTGDPHVPVSIFYNEIEESMRNVHQEELQELVKPFGIDAEHMHLVAGLTHQEFPVLLKDLGATVAVMGAVARNQFKRIFVGATAERTLEHIPCDVLIVKPNWFESPVEAAPITKAPYQTVRRMIAV